MRVYIRKIFPHDVTHEVSVTGDIVREFFYGHENGLRFTGIKSGESGVVTINAATDPRFGGDFKKILSAEKASYAVDDIIAIYDKSNSNYAMEVIGKSDKRYDTFIEMYSGKDRHLITYLDTDPVRDGADSQAVSGGRNILVYGVPGAGKSYYVDQIINGSKSERVVFHPDYTYSDFIGQIMPRLKTNAEGEEKLTYEFVPGPFTNALKYAQEHDYEMCYLVIEEINRGNAPAIFGDVFQLLDREEDGSGKYCITNYDIAKEIYGKDASDRPIKIPSNLSLLATMNTSDQNVFTLDTAFQRRWEMKYIPNDVRAADHAKSFIDDRKEITWGDFAFFVNNRIVEYNSEMSSTEDKQLGAYFIQKDDLNREHFAEKALKYLWDDVYRMERYEFFNSKIKSIGDLINTYQTAEKEPLKSVMKEAVYKSMMDTQTKSVSDVATNMVLPEKDPDSENR